MTSARGTFEGSLKTEMRKAYCKYIEDRGKGLPCPQE